MSTTVDGLIADARSFANSAYSAATGLVQAAESAIGQIGTDFTITGPGDISTSTPTLTLALPEFINPTFDPGAAPVAPGSIVPLPVLNAGVAPINTAVKPQLAEPAIPAPFRQFALTAPTINTSFAFPAVPAELQSLNIPSPTLVDRVVPTAPDLQIPLFTGVAPVNTAVAPTDYVAQFGAAYSSASATMVAALNGQFDAFLAKINPQYQSQMTAIETQLTTYLAGGTALKPSIENAIYERTRDKVNAEYKRSREAALTDGAKRGFTMPDGAVFSAMQQARQAGADNNSRAAVEIAVMQAEMEQKNLQFAVSTSTQLRTAALQASISYHGNLVQVNGQALEYAKSVLSAMIEVYNTLVKAFSIQLEAYRADVMVYETRIRAVGTAIEIYRAQIAGVEAGVRIDVAKVEVYRARVEALFALSNAYRGQIEAVVSQANLEKMKIELFGAQVQAYGTEAQAKASEFQGYSALVNGQEARMRAYGEEVRAYVANVEGYRATVQAKQAEIEAVGLTNRTILGQYTAQVEGYRALVDAKSRVATTTIEFQKTKLQAFVAQATAAESQARITQEYYRTKAQLAIENTKVVLQAAVQSAQLKTSQIEAVARTALSGAQVYEGIAGAALGGMNTLVTSNTTS